MGKRGCVGKFKPPQKEKSGLTYGGNGGATYGEKGVCVGEFKRWACATSGAVSSESERRLSVDSSSA